jgi:GeoRSP system PqqD family protein
MSDRPGSWRPKSRDGLAERVIDGEAVIVNAHGGEILVLNEVGAEIWHLLDGQHDVDAIVAHVLASFEVDEGTARADVREFLDSLATRGALRRD